MSSNRVLIRIQAMLLVLLLFLHASALGEKDPGTVVWTEEEKVTASGGSGSDRLFYTYLSRQQGGMLTGIFQTLKTAAGWSMDEGSWRAYWVLHPAIKEIAAGADVNLSREDWYALYLSAGYRLP